jgi:hypothetical protein
MTVLGTWTFIHMTAAKFKPLIISVSGFALSNVTNNFIFMILDDLCLLSAWFCYVIINIWHTKSRMNSCSWNSSCGRQTVDQFVWVLGLPLGPLTTFYLVLLSSSDNYFILLSKASSLTRKRVCSLQCNHSLVRLLTPNNHTLSSHLSLCSLFVASYGSQGLLWKYSNPPPHGVARCWSWSWS